MSFVCRLDDLANPGSAGFAIDGVLLLIVRRGNDVFGYVNNCPHIGAPLDWRPGQFLDLERRHILCANHGALFELEDGKCISGPCVGKSLQPIALTLADGEIHTKGG